MTNTPDSRRPASAAKRWARMAAGVIGVLALLATGQSGFTSTPTARAATAPLDGGSMRLVTESTGARAYWKAGFTGKGIDIAIIDSGVAPVNGLSTPGKVVLGPDLSFESQDPANRYLDTNGHGTHLAGIIAGRDTAAVPGAYGSDTTNFLGMAPDARLLSIKVADAYGHTDVSQVIAAIDWVVQHKNDNGMNIRVLNLSFATNSTALWLHDPLVQAVETAWKNGIFVVVSAGNDGANSKFFGTLGSPARSPNVMTIGATDTLGTLSLSDDFVPTFSSGGDFLRRVDAVAPGAHIISLRAPGSYADKNFAATGAYGTRFFRGSGTSQSAAVVAGAAALVLQQAPAMTPDDMKTLFRGSATKLANETDAVQGPGSINLSQALNSKLNKASKTYSKSLSDMAAWYETDVKGRIWSDGTGTLDSTRGTYRLVHNGVTLSGEKDIFGHSYSSTAMAVAAATASSWSGGTWNGNQWTASSWSASSWSASSWSASSWSSNSWSASSWSASSWSASTWSASSWSASSWSASSWSASSWSASSWSASSWSSASWS